MQIDDTQPGLCLPIQKISYGLGHIFNDLCATMWFSYVLFYFQIVLEMKSTTAGTLLMLGQLIDSLATPLAGWAIDLTKLRKSWHLGGTIAVAIGFSLIFALRTTAFDPLVITYYVLVIALFQIGWAIVQISHLSIIPEISKTHSYSSELTAIRYAVSVCCSISVYLITLVILGNNGETENIGPNDFYKFKEIALIITFIGLLTSMLFYCGLLGSYDNEYEEISGKVNDDVDNLNAGNEKNFLKSMIVYYVSFMYMSSRLFTTLNLVYIPLYIDERAGLDQNQQIKMRQSVATVPLVSYVASFMTSIVLKFRKGNCNDRVVYFFGSIVGLVASIWIAAGNSDTSEAELYAIAILIGVSGSTTIIASLCLTANFVKSNGYDGALVYGAVTFTDKLISGVVVLIVQNLQCTPRSACPHYYEHILTYICGIVSLFGLFSLVSLQVHLKKAQDVQDQPL